MRTQTGKTTRTHARARLPVMRYLAVASLLGLLAASSSGAVTLAQTDPFFFPTGGVSNTGFVPADVAGESIRWELDSSNPQLCAGALPFPDMPMGACEGKTAREITVVSQILRTPVDQNPQARGDTPDAADPLIATSDWTFRNDTGVAFTSPVIVLFTGVVADDPDLEVGLDGNLLDIARLTVGSSEMFYGALSLGTLGVGETVTVTWPIRYIVNGPLPLGPDVVPPLGPDLVIPQLLLVGVVVPEPATAALLAMGLVVLAARRARRCA